MLMKKTKTKCVVLVLLICFVMTFFAGCKKEDTLANHKDEEAFFIGDESVTMLEASYYIMEYENMYNEMAKKENPHNPQKYWNGYFFAAGSLFKTWVKEQAYEVCICDNIYYQEAVNNGFELELAYQVMANDEAASIYSNMTEKQKKETGLTVEEIYNIMLKKQYRAQYAEELASSEKLREYEEGAVKALEISGGYYKELLEKYNVSINEDCVWDELEFGTLTIN